MINILTPCMFTLELDKERGAPVDITIQKQDINGFQATIFSGISKLIPPYVYYDAFSLPSKQGLVVYQRNRLKSSAGSSKVAS